MHQTPENEPLFSLHQERGRTVVRKGQNKYSVSNKTVSVKDGELNLSYGIINQGIIDEIINIKETIKKIDLNHSLVLAFLDLSDLSLDALDLSGAILLGHKQIDLSISLSRTTILNLNMDNIICSGIADLSQVIIEKDGRFRESTFQSECLFTSAKLKGETIFQGSTFLQMCDFQNTIFNSKTTIKNCSFFEHVSFIDAEFHEDLRIADSTFFSTSIFYKTKFKDVDFNRIRFKGPVSFRSSRFYSEALFRYCDFVNYFDFSFSSFNEKLDFESISFESGMDEAIALFNGCTVTLDANFNNITFSAPIVFDDTLFKGNLFLSGSMQTVSLSRVIVKGSAHIGGSSHINRFECPFSIIEGLLEVGKSINDEVEINDFIAVNCHFGETIFKHSNIGNTNFSRTIFEGNVNFNFSRLGLKGGCAVFKYVSFEQGATFKHTWFRKADFSWANFKSSVTFTNDIFKEKTKFMWTTFEGKIANFIDSRFLGDTDFWWAVFSGDAVFMRATLDRGAARFDNVKYLKRASYSSCVFKNGSFLDVMFCGDADFQDATFYGRTDFSKSIFRISCNMSNCKFGSKPPKNSFTSFNESEFVSDVDFRNSSVSGDFFFTKVICRSKVDFSESTFSGKTFFNETTVTGESYWGGAFFIDDSFFNNAVFISKCFFTGDSRCVFGGKAEFIFSSFALDAVFKESCFIGETAFNDSMFESKLNIEDTLFKSKALFERCRFKQDVDASNSTFIKDVTFEKSIFNSVSSFEGSTFEREARFRESVFENSANFKSSKMSIANFYASIFKSKGDFSYSTITNAVFTFSEFGSDAIFFEATILETTNFKDSRYRGNLDCNSITIPPVSDFTEIRCYGPMKFIPTTSGLLTADFSKSSFDFGAEIDEKNFALLVFKKCVFRGTTKITASGDLRLDDCIVNDNIQIKFSKKEKPEDDIATRNTNKTLFINGANISGTLDAKYFNKIKMNDVKAMGEIHIDFEELVGKKDKGPIASIKNNLAFMDNEPLNGQKLLCPSPDVFLVLKENYHSLGKYDDEDRAYVLYRRSKRKDEKKKGKAIADYIGEYGTNLWRIVTIMALVFLIFGIIFSFFISHNVGIEVTFSGQGGISANIANGFYLSGITFLTIGLSDVVPLVGITEALALIEGGLGVFLMAFFTIAFARKTLR